MNPKQKRLYLIAIYLIIVISSFTLLAFGFDPGTDSWRSVFLNLSTELFAIAVVFFLVDFLFSVEDWELSERVNKLLGQLQNKRPPAEAFFSETVNIESYLQSANSIDLCGVTLTSTLHKRFSTLRERLFDGAQIRILIIEPSSPTLWMATWRSEDDYKIDYYQKRLDATLNDIEYLYKNWQDFQQTSNHAAGSLSIRLMKYPPSFGILSFDKHKANGVALIELYPHHAGYGSPPNFLTTKKDDPKWHNYFLEQFDAMWEAATDWQPGMSATAISSTELLTRQPSASDVFIKRLSTLEPYFENANDIRINGYSLERTITDYRSVFLRCLKKGAKIKILLVDEEKLKDGFNFQAGTYYDQALALKATLQKLHWLSHHPENNGTIEVRVMNSEPKFHMVSVNADSENGQTYIEFGTMQWVQGECPRVELDKQRDLYWFEFFHNQFESVWKKSLPMSLEDHQAGTDSAV